MWDQTDDCAKQYRCSVAYYLMYFLLKSYQIVLVRAFDTPGHGKYVVDGFNTVHKLYLATHLRMRSIPELHKIEIKCVRVDAMTDKGECKPLLDLCDEVGTKVDEKHVKCEAKSHLQHK